MEVLDPFLMLDHFQSADPEDYKEGFPMHPHRGIETVTYMISGSMEHQDSIGNKGIISAGDVQWMTAGSGIMHQEMPKRADGEMHGFQLWVNLPRANKMMPPRYRDIKARDVPIARPAAGIEVKVIAGSFGRERGPVRDLIVPVEYFDAHFDSGAEIILHARAGDHAFIYVYEGSTAIGDAPIQSVRKNHLAILDDGDDVLVKAGDDGCQFLFVHGPPLREPIAWGGPIVMNTREELDLAFDELGKGTFIRKG